MVPDQGSEVAAHALRRALLSVPSGQHYSADDSLSVLASRCARTEVGRSKIVASIHDGMYVPDPCERLYGAADGSLKETLPSAASCLLVSLCTVSLELGLTVRGHCRLLAASL